MYLTRFKINPQRRGAKKLLASPQAMHAAVMCSYQESPKTPSSEDESRILWRVDHYGPRASLLISGPNKPDLTHLCEQAGWPTAEPGWETASYGPFLESLKDGQR
ncbi:MAG TPA: type I-E CRISPR-associated protein Cas6/Cse3/CasE, partial [Candidatus Stackebrandtia faecavium]|nr:type I-E CRISPR-associated protein Cas6/Cse3/CasE [Candidatus Stackebrandtia faecavium]